MKSPSRVSIPKITGFGFMLSGISLMLVAIFADRSGDGGRVGMGAAQVSGILLGVLLLMAGIFCLTISPDALRRVFEYIKGVQKKITGVHPGFWIYFTFVLVYLSFFVVPVFLNSKVQIDYVDKYIPDQGRIGFDLRSIVTRIENWYRTGESPYSDGFIAYPPFTILSFSPFILLAYPVYYHILTWVTILCHAISTFLLPLLVTGRRNLPAILLFFFTGLFSYGLQFELERGQFNVITFTLCLLSVCLFHFAPRGFRVWAYLLFSITVQLKVYPIFFILMFVDDWRNWRREVGRMAGLALFNFSLLFILGYRIFLDFLRVITAYQFDYGSNRIENLSIKGFVYSLSMGEIRSIPEWAWKILERQAGLLELLLLAVLGLCFLSIIARLRARNLKGFQPSLLLACTMAVLVVPSVSNDYKLAMLASPFLLALTGMPDAGPHLKKASFHLSIGISSLAYWMTLYPFTNKPEILYRNFPVLMILMVAMAFPNFNEVPEESPVILHSDDAAEG
jgi:hypothetical protein